LDINALLIEFTSAMPPSVLPEDAGNTAVFFSILVDDTSDTSYTDIVHLFPTFSENAPAKQSLVSAFQCVGLPVNDVRLPGIDDAANLGLTPATSPLLIPPLLFCNYTTSSPPVNWTKYTNQATLSLVLDIPYYGGWVGTATNGWYQQAFIAGLAIALDINALLIQPIKALSEFFVGQGGNCVIFFSILAEVASPSTANSFFDLFTTISQNAPAKQSLMSALQGTGLPVNDVRLAGIDDSVGVSTAYWQDICAPGRCSSLGNLCYMRCSWTA
jgi:hypothetical protein